MLWVVALYAAVILGDLFIVAPLARAYGWRALDLSRLSGLRGAATATMVGLVFGIGFCLNGRSLIPLMIAHGLTDTISLVAIYAGAHPG